MNKRLVKFHFYSPSSQRLMNACRKSLDIFEMVAARERRKDASKKHREELEERKKGGRGWKLIATWHTTVPLCLLGSRVHSAAKHRENERGDQMGLWESCVHIVRKNETEHTPGLDEKERGIRRGNEGRKQWMKHRGLDERRGGAQTHVKLLDSFMEYLRSN